jgi:hypothetical protein
MDIRKRALELIQQQGLSEEDRMKQSLDESNQIPEEKIDPENTSFFDKLKNLYQEEDPYKKGPGVRLNQNKVKQFKRD